MVVPHRHERPAGSSILQIGVVEIRAIDGAIVVERGRYVEVADFLAVFEPHDVADAAVVHAARAILRIRHHLVDEVAEVQHEAQALVRRSALVLVNHATVGVLRAVVDVLAAHERERHRARIVCGRRRHGAAHAAREAVGIHEAIPVLARGLQTADEHATGEIGFRAHHRPRLRDHALKAGILGHLEAQRRFALASERTAGP